MPVIKSDAIVRADVIDAEMGWPVGLALGRLVRLWDRTQTGNGTDWVTPALLCSWCSVDPAEISRFTKACVGVHLLEAHDGDRFLVVGNRLHVENIKKYKEAKSLAGKASGESRRKMNKTRTKDERVFEQNANKNEPSSSSFSSSSSSALPSPSSGPVTPSPEKRARAYDPPKPPGNDLPTASPPGRVSDEVEEIPLPEPPAELTKTKRPVKERLRDAADPKNLPEPTTDGSRVWNAYALAYIGVYGHPPVRNGKANSMCAQLVQRLGVKDAESVARFYLTHGQAYYTARCHPLDACVRDAEGLRTQMLAGHRVSLADAKRVDDRQSNEQVFAAAAERWRNQEGTAK